MSEYRFKMFSPSATETFGQCQRMWALQEMGWRTDIISYPTVAMAVGTGIHHGAHLCHLDVMLHAERSWPASTMEHYAEQAVLVAREPVETLISQGALPVEQVEDWEHRVTSQVMAGVKAYMKAFAELYPRNWHFISSEEAYGSVRGEGSYRGRLDLLVKDEAGKGVVDIKTKQPFRNSYYRELFVNDFRYSWQIYSYCHMVYLETGELPKSFYLVMIELTTKPKVTIHDYLFNERFYQEWLHAAEQRWLLMTRIEEGELVPSINDGHFFYGRPCVFKQACFQCQLNEHEMLNAGYIQVKDSK